MMNMNIILQHAIQNTKNQNNEIKQLHVVSNTYMYIKDMF